VPRYPQHLSILIAYLEDTTEFYEIAQKRGHPLELLRYLEKHRQWKPEAGDGTQNAVSLKDWGKHSA
jgi:hypothetical protein